MSRNHPHTPPSEGGDRCFQPSPWTRGGEGGVRNDIFAYPTESFYALGVDATNPVAIRQLFRVKHREPGKPIALIAANLAQVKKYFVMSKDEERLARKYWPGALTILLRPKKTIASQALTPLSPPSDEGGNEGGRRVRRIGVRIPAHAQARKLALWMGVPITATSANLSGQPPTKSPRVLKQYFPDILQVHGRCGRQKIPSTIIRVDQTNITILRHGAVRL